MIILLLLGILAAFIIATFTKRDWLGPMISGVVFIIYGALSYATSHDSLYFGMLACFVQFVGAYKIYKMQLRHKK